MPSSRGSTGQLLPKMRPRGLSVGVGFKALLANFQFCQCQLGKLRGLSELLDELLPHL